MTGQTGTAPDRDALTTSVMELRAALDAWAAAILAAADAHPGDPDSAVEEPALGVAEDGWDNAFDAFQEAAAAVLDVELDDDGEDLDLQADPAESVGVALYATVTGPGAGDPVVLVDAAGEQVVAALEAVGFEVPEWSVRIVPVEGLHLADDLAADEDDA